MKTKVLLPVLIIVLIFVFVAVLRLPKILSARASGTNLPEGMTHLQYLKELRSFDQNQNYIIDQSDTVAYEAMLQKNKTFDINSDQKSNATEQFFLTSRVGVNTSELEKTFMKDPVLASQMQIEYQQNSQKPIPEVAKNTQTSTFSVLEDSSGDKSYGKSIVPQVLGSVSTFTGAATFSLPIELPAGMGGFTPSLELGYSSDSIDEARPSGSTEAAKFYLEEASYNPSFAGHGFNLSGIGSIIRDTKEKKSQPTIHSFILNLPGVGSSELRYNSATKQWASIPDTFLQIAHSTPGEYELDLNGTTKAVFDPSNWIITTKDGNKYYFGEENFASKINGDGRIHGSKDDKQGTNLLGSLEGDSAVEIYQSKDKMMVMKWWIRKVVTPDGKVIEYSYDSPQVFDNNKFHTLYTYPKKISWNNGTMQVRIERERRPDQGNNAFLKDRLKNIIVEKMSPQDKKTFILTSRYEFNYFSSGEKHIAKIPKNELDANSWKISLLKSITKYGVDNKTALPSTNFQYSMYEFGGEGYSQASTYVSAIENGMGGVTKFEYEPHLVNFFDNENKLRETHRKIRVKTKLVQDLIRSRTSREELSYTENGQSTALGYFRDYRQEGERGGFDVQYLGHRVVEDKIFDYDGTTVSHTKTYFYQANVEPSKNCFYPSPVHGKPERSIQYENGTSNILTQSTMTYRIRFDGKDELLDGSQCSSRFDRQAYFVYPYDTLSIVTDKVIDSTQSTNLRTISRVLKTDLFGNPLLSVNYGEVDSQNRDIDPSDNQYSYAYFLPPSTTGLKSLPYMTYSSDIEECGSEKYECQWGRALVYYYNESEKDDVKNNKLLELSSDNDIFAKQSPSLSYSVLSKTYLDKNEIGKTFSKDSLVPIVGKSRFYHLTGTSQVGNLIATFAPAPNLEKFTNIESDLVQQSGTVYDDFYHVYPIESSNALGHKTKFEDYEVSLSLPKKISTQIDKNPSKPLAVMTLKYDNFGRLVESFAPDPDNLGKTLTYPSILNFYFDSTSPSRSILSSTSDSDKARKQQVATRSGKVAGLTSDGKAHYVFADAFFDGSGSNIQTQVLSTMVDDRPQRLVSFDDYTVDGIKKVSFEPILTTAIQVGSDLQNPVPSIEPLDSRYKKASEVTLDSKRRVTSQITYDNLTGKSQVSTSETGLALDNKSPQMLKTLVVSRQTSPQNLVSSATSDTLGRVISTRAYSKSDPSTILISENEYPHPFLSKPIKSHISDTSGTKVTNSFAFNRSGQLLKSSEPSLGTYTFEYFIDGKKRIETNSSGEQTVFVYDKLGRTLIQKYLGNLNNEKIYTRQTSTKDEVVSIYDEGSNALGKLSKITHLTGEKSFEYDSGQRLITTTSKTFDLSKKFSTNYNALSQEIGSTYPDGTQVATFYDKEGRIVNTKIDGQDAYIGGVFDKFQRQIKARVKQGVDNYTVNTNFDGFGRLNTYQIFQNSAPVINQTLQFDSNNNLTALSDNIGTSSTNYTYTYSPLGQLKTSSSKLGNFDYAYDLMGRITSKKEKNSLKFDYPQSVLAGATNEQFYAPKKITIDENKSISPTYHRRGGLEFDEKNCYFYNRLGQMIRLGVKKDDKSTCKDESSWSVKYQFYYDESGDLNLEEQFSPASTKDPSKKTYYFGTYEETIEN